ncbi:MAG: DinB family protein [Geothrix sp.]|nr:DinB family protein [Geothrix sp.]
MERGRLWRSAFGNNVRLLEMNGTGLTPEMASQRSANGVASAAWILGHMISMRRRIVRLAGGDLLEDPAWEQHYARGGPGAKAHLSWPELVEAFQAADQALKAAFQQLADWDRPTTNPALGVEQPLEQVLAFLFMHECYHLGQIGIIRKLHGLPGAI